ncbi:MAG: hypothetical protein EOO77_31500, partial [Oxalobacteraceae bacterium]
MPAIHHSLDDISYYPIGTVCWVSDNRGPVEVRVEKLTIYVSESGAYAEHHLRPVDLPEKTPSYMSNLLWNPVRLDLLHENADEARKALRERFRP